MQTEILKLIDEHNFLFATELIIKLRKNGETKEYIRKSLKNLRKYNEIGYALITYNNQNRLVKKYPYLKQKLDGGYKIRRPSFLYFPIEDK